MCTISNKKANWYIKKGLGSWEEMETKEDYKDCKQGEEEVRTIRLNFVPENKKPTSSSSSSSSSPSPSDDLYHKRVKKNSCCVCSTSHPGFMRHYVVPSSFRSLFPRRFKSHMSHDVVLVCSGCHVDVQARTGREITKVCKEGEERWKRKVEGEGGKVEGEWMVDRETMEARSKAVAIRKYGGNMPEEVRREHERFVKEYLKSIGRGGGRRTRKLNYATKRWRNLETSSTRHGIQSTKVGPR